MSKQSKQRARLLKATVSQTQSKNVAYVSKRDHFILEKGVLYQEITPKVKGGRKTNIIQLKVALELIEKDMDSTSTSRDVKMLIFDGF